MSPRSSGRESRAAFAAQLRARSNRYYGAFDRGRLIGTVLGTHDTRKGWISRLAVDPDYRRRGIARRLVSSVERGLRDQGIAMFAALVEPDNEASAAFFRAVGYEVIPMTYARRKARPDV